MRAFAVAAALSGLTIVGALNPTTCLAAEPMAAGAAYKQQVGAEVSEPTQTEATDRSSDPAETGSLAAPEASEPQVYRNYRIGGPEG